MFDALHCEGFEELDDDFLGQVMNHTKAEKKQEVQGIGTLESVMQKEYGGKTAPVDLIKKEDFSAILDGHLETINKKEVKENKGVQPRRKESMSQDTEEYESEESEEEEDILPINWDDVLRKEKTKVIHGKEY